MKNNLFIYVAVFIPLLISVEAQAGIYKCTNAQAEVYYNDKPCPVTAKEKEMKAVKDPVGGYIPAPYSPSDDAGENIENPGKKGLIIGIDSTNKDMASKQETQTGQSSQNSSSSSSD